MLQSHALDSGHHYNIIVLDYLTNDLYTQEAMGWNKSRKCKCKCKCKCNWSTSVSVIGAWCNTYIFTQRRVAFIKGAVHRHCWFVRGRIKEKISTIYAIKYQVYCMENTVQWSANTVQLF